MGFVGSLLLCIAGLCFQFRMFTHNDFGVLFFTFFFFSLALSGFAYLIGTGLRTSHGALLIGVAVAFLGFVMSFVVSIGAFPYGQWPYGGGGGVQPRYLNCTAHAMRNEELFRQSGRSLCLVTLARVVYLSAPSISCVCTLCKLCRKLMTKRGEQSRVLAVQPVRPFADGLQERTQGMFRSQSEPPRHEQLDQGDHALR